MRKNKSSKRMENKLFFLFFITSLIVFLFGSVYAVFSYYHTKDKLSKVETGCFSISFMEGTNEIRLTKTNQLEDDEGMTSPEYKFIVENNCSLTASYELLIETEEEITSDAVKLSVDARSPISLSSLVKDEQTKNTYSISREQLTAGASKTYSLHFWIDTKEERDNPTYKGYISLQTQNE